MLIYKNPSLYYFSFTSFICCILISLRKLQRNESVNENKNFVYVTFIFNVS